MKRTKQMIAMVLVGNLFLMSCSSGIESDAQKVANLQCKAQKLMKDPSSLKKSQKLMSEAKLLMEKMQQKYTSLEEKQKFAQVLSKVSRKCN